MLLLFYLKTNYDTRSKYTQKTHIPQEQGVVSIHDPLHARSGCSLFGRHFLVLIVLHSPATVFAQRVKFVHSPQWGSNQKVFSINR